MSFSFSLHQVCARENRNGGKKGGIFAYFVTIILQRGQETPESYCGRGDGAFISPSRSSLPGRVLSSFFCFSLVTPWRPDPLQVAAGV